MVNSFLRDENCSVYEIYPESETPHLTKIGHLDPCMDPRAFLLPGTVVWYGFYRDRIVFRVWDYQLNHSISFSVDVDVQKFGFDIEVYFIFPKAPKLASNPFVGR
jgi:hypothetical protein